MDIIPIEDILTLMTANVVIGALVVSLVGATIATAVRHKTSNNWRPNMEDVWYYILSGGVSIGLVLLGFGTGEILAATTGINTPIAILKTGLERRNGSDTIKSLTAKIEAIEQKRADELERDG